MKRKYHYDNSNRELKRKKNEHTNINYNLLKEIERLKKIISRLHNKVETLQKKDKLQYDYSHLYIA